MSYEIIGPRDVAVLALRDKRGNTSASLAKWCTQYELSAQDRALAGELAMGVVRRRGTLDEVLRSFLDRPKKHLPSPVKEILQLAAYQLIFLDRVPDFAAVDEAVEQTRRFHHKRQTGLVNGVLRNVTRGIGDIVQARPPMESDVVPLDRNRFRRMTREIYFKVDPEKHPAAYLAGAWSLPRYLTQRWIERYGVTGTWDLCAHAAARPPVILRVNRHRADVSDVLESIRGQGASAERHDNGRSIVLHDPGLLLRLAAFQDGLVQPQDPTATLVVDSLPVRPGMRVLDFCAAPGTKTTHLAECMHNEGVITAVDVSEEKLRRIHENRDRMDYSIIEPCLAEQVGSLTPHSYDVVLVDAPCSNTGVLARRPEARWRQGSDAISRLVGDQKALLHAASHFLASGGTLVHSTCSIEPEEGGQIARWLPKRDGRFQLKQEKFTLPGGEDAPTRWRDGGYIAMLG